MSPPPPIRLRRGGVRIHTDPPCKWGRFLGSTLLAIKYTYYSVYIMPDIRADQAMAVNAGQFQKGVSGNPGGRPREIGEIRDLARAHTADAIEALRGIAVDLTAPASARVAASEALLNRAWGRPSLAISAEGEAEPVELIVRWAGQ